MSTPTFKVWHASGTWRGGWGAYQDYEAVVVAETESAARGWLLMHYADMTGDCWTIEEIPTDTAGVTPISSASS